MLFLSGKDLQKLCKNKIKSNLTLLDNWLKMNTLWVNENTRNKNNFYNTNSSSRFDKTFFCRRLKLFNSLPEEIINDFLGICLRAQ